MVKYHKSDGYWTRCRATVRRGQGVTDCPLEIDGAEAQHVLGLGGVARAGGGKLRRWIGEDRYRITNVTVADEETGEYSVAGRITTVYSKNDKVIPLRDRLHQARSTAVDQLPELNEAEEHSVEKQWLALQREVLAGLEAWDADDSREFREEALAASAAAQQRLYTPRSIALLLEVATSEAEATPIELLPAIAAVREHLGEELRSHDYLTQKAREHKHEQKLKLPSLPGLEKNEVKDRATISPKPEPSPQLAEVMAVLADEFERSIHLREVQFYATDGVSLESLAPAVAARWDGSSRYDLYDLYKEEMMEVTGKTWSQLRADYGERVLDAGTEHPHFREFFIDYINDSSLKVGDLEQRFGDKLTDHKNWLVGRSVDGKQRESIRGRIQARFAKQKRGQKIVLGDPFVDRKQAEGSKDRRVIKFTNVKDLESQVTELADSGDYSEIQFNQYTPATKRYFGYLVVTTKWASLEEMIDLF